MLPANPAIVDPPRQDTALDIFGAGLAYVWNTNIVAGGGATNASTVTYLTPVVGIALGVLLLREHVAWNQPPGGPIVVLGIAISRNRPDPLLRRSQIRTR